jgi:hypothetical protein
VRVVPNSTRSRAGAHDYIARTLDGPMKPPDPAPEAAMGQCAARRVIQRGTRPGGSADEGSVLPAKSRVVQAEAEAALHDESSPSRRGDPAR